MSGMNRVLLISLASAALYGQLPDVIPVIRTPSVPPALRQYLELTQEQVTRIERLNNALRQFETQKARRAFQVQSELSEETARTSLDPMALGMRYVELEAIRREIDAERKRTVDEVQAVLTPAQRTKISALQEVLRNVGLACDAVNHNLMPLPPLAQALPGVTTSPALTTNFATFLLGGVPACLGVPTFRSGDFTVTQP